MFMMTVLAWIVPAVVVAAVIGTGRAAGGRIGGWWGASAVGLAYIAGHAAIARPAIPPVEVTDRIPWIALAATALAVFEAAGPWSKVVRWVGRSVLAALTLAEILGPVVGAGDLSRETMVWLTASGAVALAGWVNLEALAASPRGSDDFRSVVITAAGAGVALMISGSAVLGMLGMALTASLIGGRLASRGNPPGGYLPVASAVLTALVLDGYVYAFLPNFSALLLAGAPLAVWIIRLGPMKRLGPWASATLGAVAVLIPVGIAVGLAAYASFGGES